MGLRSLIASLVVLACVAPAAAAHAFTVTPTDYGFWVTVGNTERVEIWHEAYEYADPAVSISDWELPGNPTYIRRHTAGGGISQPVVIQPASSWRQFVVSQVGGSQQVAMNIPPGWPSESSGGSVSGTVTGSVTATVTAMPPCTIETSSALPVSFSDAEFSEFQAVVVLGLALLLFLSGVLVVRSL